jgi:shikimate dehydrogenase
MNTDVHGCRKALERSGWKPKGKVVLLGAGGAARAVVEALFSMGILDLVLFDLIVERAQSIKENFKNLKKLNITIGSLDQNDMKKHIKDTDLLINATPVGMWPKTESSPLPYPDLIPSDGTVFDLVYKPKKTRLLDQAQIQGAKTIHGLTMLVAQALASDEIWLERKIQDQLFDKVLDHTTKLAGKK